MLYLQSGLLHLDTTESRWRLNQVIWNKLWKSNSNYRMPVSYVKLPRVDGRSGPGVPRPGHVDAKCPNSGPDRFYRDT